LQDPNGTPPECVLVGFVLATVSYEHHVFRTALLSIVFSLTVGQNVALLCRTWCDARSVAASECHHESSFATRIVASGENCDTVDIAATAILGEDVRRDISSRDANQAIPAAHYQLA